MTFRTGGSYILKPLWITVLSLFLGLQCGFWSKVSARAEPADSLTSLSEIRQRVLNNSEEALIGEKIKVSGIANVATGVLHERYLLIYIQNDSAGLSLFSKSFEEPIQPGDSIVVSGEVQKYAGMTEVQVEGYELAERGAGLPEAVSLEKVMAFPEKYEGMLVSGSGVIRGKGTGFNGKYLTVALSDTALESMMVYVSNFHSQNQEFNFDRLSVGDNVSIEGVIGRNNSDSSSGNFKVFLRTPSDLQYENIPKSYMWLGLQGVLIVSIFVVGWILLLRRQVAKQTDIIKTSLKEKEMLLQEIHHRVKNNLAIISGLIELQLDSTSDEAALRVLRNSQIRIQSMAMVHEKLYKSATLSNIGMDVYVRDLVEAIHLTYMDQHKNIDIDFNLEAVKLDIDRVIPCALLINELVVNAFKHAFRDMTTGRLLVSLKQQEDEVELIVADNGPGLPEDFTLEGSDSLGMMLIHTFASQLSADMDVKSDDGTSFIFRFEAEGDRRKLD